MIFLIEEILHQLIGTLSQVVAGFFYVSSINCKYGVLPSRKLTYPTRKIIFKMDFSGDMLVPRRGTILWDSSTWGNLKQMAAAPGSLGEVEVIILLGIFQPQRSLHLPNLTEATMIIIGFEEHGTVVGMVNIFSSKLYHICVHLLNLLPHHFNWHSSTNGSFHQLSWQHLQNAFCFPASFISRYFALPDLRLLVVTTLPATNREFGPWNLMVGR